MGPGAVCVISEKRGDGLNQFGYWVIRVTAFYVFLGISTGFKNRLCTFG